MYYSYLKFILAKALLIISQVLLHQLYPFFLLSFKWNLSFSPWPSWPYLLFWLTYPPSSSCVLGSGHSGFTSGSHSRGWPSSLSGPSARSQIFSFQSPSYQSGPLKQVSLTALADTLPPPTPQRVIPYLIATVLFTVLTLVNAKIGTHLRYLPSASCLPLHLP